MMAIPNEKVLKDGETFESLRKASKRLDSEMVPLIKRFFWDGEKVVPFNLAATAAQTGGKNEEFL